MKFFMSDDLNIRVTEDVDEVVDHENTEVQSSHLDRLREGRFLLYWATTTLTSTSTSYTGTSTIASLECTPSSYTISSC